MIDRCLDDEALARLIAGGLAERERSLLVSHVERCDVCRELTVAAVQVSDETRTIAGRYRLQGEIGRGAMGIVHRAHDDVLDRPVAIKLLPGGDAHARARIRLVRESRALAKLRHPNVVAVHDAGWEGAQFWIAMEYVPGVTLRGWLDARDASVTEIVAVFVRAARGLAAAHAVGVVHRDFKPDNVLLDADGEPRVADFGLAHWGHVVDDPSETDSTHEVAVDLTATGAVVGTPAYMPPEQFQGGSIDARADVFAVCAVLWEALHGRRPFEESSAEARMTAIRRGAFACGDHRLGRGLRRALERGLSFDPEHRQPDMNALVDELEAAIVPRRRSRWLVAAAASALLVVGAVTVAAAQPERCAVPNDRLSRAGAPPAMQAIQRAVLARAPAMEAELAWSELRPQIEGAIAGLDKEVTVTCEARRDGTIDESEATRRAECLRLDRGALGFRLELAAQGDAQAANGLPFRAPATWCRAQAQTWADREIDPALASEYAAVETAFSEAITFADLARIDPTRERAAEALRLAEALGDPVLIARARLVRGHATFDRREAESMLVRAAFEATAVGEHATAAEAWIYAGYFASDEHAAGYVEHARDALEHVPNDDMRAYLDGLCAHIVGRLLLSQGRVAEARAEYERAIAMAHDLAPGRVPEFWIFITYAWWAEGDLHAAIASQRDLVKWHERARGPTRHDLSRALWNLADLEREAGELDRALETIQRVQTVASASEDATSHASHLLGEAEIRIARGELDEAERAIDRAEADPGAVSRGSLVALRGVLASARGDHGAAVRLLGAVLQALGPEPDLGLDGPDATAALADALRRNGQPLEALAVVEPALERLRSARSPLPERGRLACALGWILVDLGRPAEALPHFEEALDLLVAPKQRARAEAGRVAAVAPLSTG